KAGMTSVVVRDMYENSPSYGQEVVVPCTILECPPLFAYGLRVYVSEKGALRCLTEIIVEGEKEINRKTKALKQKNIDEKKKKIEENMSKIKEVRLLFSTLPKEAALKKTPEIFELTICGGTIEEKIKYGFEKLGKKIKIGEIFKEGQFVDAIGITKGKGTQGPVKRFGIKIQTRKTKGHRRHVGCLGAWHPARVLYTVPMAGQLGYQRRTEWNKQILKIGTNPEEINPLGGIPNYGLVNSEYVLIKGSIPGPKKRLVILRFALRNPREKPFELKEIIKAPQN
ncbi:MAG: 50S ribosomal protein L3, partial [archaeon]